MAKLVPWREDLRRRVAGKVYVDLLLPRSAASPQCTSVPRHRTANSHSSSVEEGREKLGIVV